MDTPSHILRKYWSFDSFRPLQEEIVTCALNERDCLVLLPTGGGKSICFQVPALAKEGLCIVISPLVALMKDQVSNLKAKGIKAMALTSGISYSELDTLLDNCIYGQYKFLYLSPERLQQELVQERIKQMNVNLIAVDEAHCISQWGNDFRPAYKNIKALRELLPQTPVMALTATATQKVMQDILLELDLFSPEIFKQSYKRENLSYQVLYAEDKHRHLINLFKHLEGSAIVYVRSRAATIEISSFLNKNGVSSQAFHGGLASYEKEVRLQQWLQNDVQVMVATNAFGMGIDKPDVRSVIHFMLPDSIESYYQEAGRAGRDGLPASAIVLKNNADILLLKKQFIHTLPNVEFIKTVYKKLCNYFQIPFGEGENTSHEFDFVDFCNVYGFSGNQTFNALQVLDRMSVIALSAHFQKKTALQFIVSNEQLFSYMEKNKHTVTVIQSILRSYGGIFEQQLPVNTELLSKKTGIPEAVFIKTYKQLEQEGIIELHMVNTDTEITFIEPREDDRNINRIARLITHQNDLKTNQVQAVIDYVENETECRSVQLLHYFDETLVTPCGNCSVCLRNKKLVVKGNDIRNKIIVLLEAGDASSHHIANQLPFDEEVIKQTLKQMLEYGIIVITKQNTYQLAHI